MDKAQSPNRGPRDTAGPALAICPCMPFLPPSFQQPCTCCSPGHPTPWSSTPQLFLQISCMHISSQRTPSLITPIQARSLQARTRCGQVCVLAGGFRGESISLIFWPQETSCLHWFIAPHHSKMFSSSISISDSLPSFFSFISALVSILA